MPSLRRTFSSPSVRSSPYHYQTSSSISSSNATRTSGHAPRRSSGSETSQRRVLADIDWWRVQEGQREVRGEDVDDQEPDASETAEGDPAAIGTGADMGAVGIILAPPVLDAGVAVGDIGGDFYESLSPLPQFAELAISPRTPMRRRHASESSESSTESTPDSTYGPLFPLHHLGMGFMDMHVPPYVPPPPTSIGIGHPSGRPKPLGPRSTSYSAVEFQLSINARHREMFEDIFPPPPPFFSHTQMDAEDLFY
ncbi:hypothetical protein OBBRIDRAFT_811140 [Obba rivulosa]|uniref:Uncharacterized protein n=1 Tax=Obba rivulosa TaxID=1052685 RepID=A0A8E2DPJ3_9APHY|nr:hypothetical protein OBBRIDRAFT_811140 [Obba rivulosa]